MATKDKAAFDDNTIQDTVDQTIRDNPHLNVDAVAEEANRRLGGGTININAVHAAAVAAFPPRASAN